jgi:hypothetical protein
MLALFTWFTTSKLGKEVGIALLILALIGGVYWKGHASGYQDGHAAGGKETFDQLRQGMDDEREKTKQLLAQYDKQIAAKDQEIAASQQIVATQQAALVSLAQQQIATQKQISSLSDAQVVLDLASRLKIRAASDATPTLYPSEVRRADEIVGDYPLVSKKVDSLTTASAAQQDQIKSLDEKVTLVNQKFQAAVSYIDESDQRFKNAYNVFNSIEGRPMWQKILTFGILRNKKITKLTPLVPPVKPEILK